jgi:hypothetical protein
MTATLFSVPKLQVKWKTHGKTFSEFSGARQNILGIGCSTGSPGLRKSGKTLSEMRQDFSVSKSQEKWKRHGKTLPDWT